MKKDAEDHEVKVRLADGVTNIIFGPLTKKGAEEMAADVCENGCNKDGTYYPVYQVAWAKVYQTNV